MILGTLTIGCILTLLIINGVKMWNLFNKGEKYPWQWIMITFALSLLAFTGLYQVFLVSLFAAEQDSLLNAALLESLTYYKFGQLMMFMAFMFTLAELAISYKLIIFPELAEAREKEERGFSLFPRR